MATLAKNQAICDDDHIRGRGIAVMRAGSTTEGELPMIKIILAAVAALAVTVGTLAITGAGDDKSSALTMTTLPLQY
jgi:hypothetical protein